MICFLSSFFVIEAVYSTWLSVNITDERVEKNIPLQPQFKIIKDIVIESCEDLTCLSEHLKTDNTVVFPIEQFQRDIPVDEIECKNGLVITIKSSDSTPACVKLETKQELIKRGWGKE